MRIARIAQPTGMSFAILEGEGPGATAAEIEGHPFAQIKLSGQRWALEDVRLLAPILPSKVVCVGRNYAEHAAELGNEVPKEPLIFLKPSTSVIGPGEHIRLPAVSDQVEHEAELAVVIGLPGARGLDREAAKGSIFGYTCANDVTARDLQQQDVQFTRAKGFDSFCPLGPWIETDPLENGADIANTEIRCEVGGEVRQLGSTKDMVFDPPALVAYVSQIMTLLPGDVVLTGTPAGVGPLQAGETVAVSVAGIGTLSNKVVPSE
ncbi:fumarylacetoacetate hydrolase family protein [Glycomyces harbinensis]|uniref:2-keto-4-pentenoate hydratase/2-oxohepta-3-ene-1,7-dioic acid hydratase (Catechol pathway) n=1 Tax=Glycomyces harbinensis TaxID=58114 RepID=A0A1G6T0N2_9ACTN|nr:fumarylacetoacetate hydrolase family protein [Glycomyces harbinensis]SDD22444.1 2-keto-4-pentenoate hydratase/2-oxohepta-3-ene-1,7-dioic acid hydratase (catechol pathway) [Glycomyces harbinensis]